MSNLLSDDDDLMAAALAAPAFPPPQGPPQMPPPGPTLPPPPVSPQRADEPSPYMQLLPACLSGVAIGTYASVPGVLGPHIARTQGVLAQVASDFSMSAIPPTVVSAGLVSGVLSIALAPHVKTLGARRIALAGSVLFPLGFFALPMPTWLSHVLASVFLHQDMVFLHHQEKILAKRGYANAAGASGEYVQHVFTPTPQDKGVIAFRKWLQFYAGGGVPWAAGAPPMPEREMDKTVLFDVYNTHTKNCAVCLEALKNLKLLRNGFFAASFASVGLSHGPAAALLPATQ